MVVSMVLANPLFDTGCVRREPRIVVDEEELEKEDQNSSTPILHGGGHGGSPFIFHSYTSGGSSASNQTISNGGWKTWSTPAKDGSYSGVHASSFTS